MRQIDVVIVGLLEKYEAKISGAQPFIRRSMSIAYEAGLRDALEWVKEYNLAANDKAKTMLANVSKPSLESVPPQDPA